MSIPGPGSPRGVLLLDKPAGYTSTRALARAKRALGARKAGHTGTLDPFATGLLALAFGEATKFSRFLIDASKAYVATLKLGIETSTGDPEGEVTRRAEPVRDEARIDEVLRSFEGVQDQVPPMHSAVHFEGKRLYELAREGLEVERAPRRVEIRSLRRIALAGDELQVAVECSKGTYVRSLAMDIGRALGCGASLVALRRTAVGPFAIDAAVTLEALEARGVERARAALLPVEALVAGLERRDASAAESVRFQQGQPIACDEGPEGRHVAVYDPAGQLLGVGLAQASGKLAPARVVVAANGSNSPDFA